MSAEYTEHVYQEYHHKGYEPIHQREEIVRCKDCIYAMFEGKTCSRIDPWYDEYWFNVEPDGFCAWGEREAVE